MRLILTRSDLTRLKRKLHRVRVACWSAIQEGDCRAVARLTCEAARLRDAVMAAERWILRSESTPA
jgi:hypothetical protein